MFHTGQLIGDYKLLRKLGKGGFGEVWLAEKRSEFVSKKVAVKLPLDEQIDLEIVRREASLWEEASGHPNVLPLIDARTFNGQVVFVSEYAEGGSLADKLSKEGKFPLQKSVEMTIGILNGLEFLHNKKIIHRDIKPQNILLQANTPRLADFGISRAMNSNSDSSTVSGTDAYMAPEAFSGKRNVQTDIWSVGVVLYQLVTGRLPFSQPHPAERMFAILQAEIAPLPNEIPNNLKLTVQKSLAKNPDERFQTATEMRESLEKVLLQIKHPTFAETEVFSDFKTIKDEKGTIEDTFFVADTTDVLPKKSDSEIPKTEVQTLSKQPRTNVLKPLLIVSSIILILLLIPVSFGLYSLVNSYSAETKLVPYRQKDKWGFTDQNKKILIQPRYDSVEPFGKDGLAQMRLLSDPRIPNLSVYGFLDKNGKEVITAKYTSAENFSEGMAQVCLGKKCGFINAKGEQMIPFIYDAAYSFSENLAYVVKDGKGEFIDKTGRTAFVTDFTIEQAGSFSNDLALVQKDSKWGYINKSGALVIENKYYSGYNFKDEIACVSKAEGYGLVKIKFGCINKTGAEIIPFIYDTAGVFNEGLITVSKDNKYGFIDKSNNPKIPLKYDFAYNFSEGLAAVKVGGKWGYISKDGIMVISPKFDTAYAFENGIALININGKFGYIDQLGNEYFED